MTSVVKIRDGRWMGICRGAYLASKSKSKLCGFEVIAATREEARNSVFVHRISSCKFIKVAQLAILYPKWY